MSFLRGVWDEVTGAADRRRFGFAVLEIAADEIRRLAAEIYPEDNPCRHGMKYAADFIEPDPDTP